ncbi:MAG: undecaprenyldiphospho-muramoylpentapeptide beta-N-acetylglucosaminyltransferase [Proteobacteria bacterium]|nr:undecaprenyldiphospho-muramoylpentapeptide beta-N-acetylglucosaminyltransferase [Pseudomonadota bacterium]
MRWMIAGGGTGGHVTPALALAEVAAARGDRVLLVGSRHGLEARLVPEAGFELLSLGSRQVMGRGLLGALGGGVEILRATLAARRSLVQFGADWVVSVGGYAAMPAVLAAVWNRTPLALVEPNAMPGRVNRLSARRAKRIFTAFEGASGVLRRNAEDDRVQVTGVPVRRALLESFATPTPRRHPEPPIRLLVFGGSQGARQLNDACIAAAADLSALPLAIVHQTGEADREQVAAAYSRAGIEAEVIAFEPDMPARYRWADLALCRAGALTVAELALAGLPALLVPYPYAADDHQAANARELESAGAARCLDAKAFDARGLVCELQKVVANPARLVAMSAAAAGAARRDAAERIIEECAVLLARE